MSMTNIILGSLGEATCSLVPAIGETPVVLAYYRTITNLMEAGHCPLRIVENITNRTRAIIAEIDSEIVGFILFAIKYDLEEKPTWIFLSYVNPSHRRRGIYKLMYSCLETHTQSLGSMYTESFVSGGNAEMIHAASALGREPISTKLLDTQPDGYYIVTNRFKKCS